MMSTPGGWSGQDGTFRRCLAGRWLARTAIMLASDQTVLGNTCSLPLLNPRFARLVPAAATMACDRSPHLHCQHPLRFKGDGATAVGAVPTGKATRQRKPQPAKKKLQNQNVPDNTLSIDWDRYAISGTCKTLEKAYFRLTSAPDPSTVRPAPVLRKALLRLVGLIASGDVNYFYSQDQFKGMRQDCVVQALKGDLPIAIYEAHARAALEYGDTAEYNQCQGQLRGLYTPKTRKAEFIAYRILYQSVFWFLNKNKGEIAVGLLESLGDAEGVTDNDNVSHALQVRQALVSSNYSAFFRLYDAAPALGRALMDLAVPKLRFACLEGCVLLLVLLSMRLPAFRSVYLSIYLLVGWSIASRHCHHPVRRSCRS